jgi:hypothetical protein
MDTLPYKLLHFGRIQVWLDIAIIEFGYEEQKYDEEEIELFWQNFA